MTTASTVEEWREIASRSFVPLECQGPASAFHASIEDIRLRQGLSVGHIRSGPAVITRTPRLAARAASDDLHFSLQLRSAGYIRQGRAHVAMTPGSVAVYTTHLPYQLDYSAPGQRLIVMQISRAELGLPASTVASAVDAIAVTDSPARRVFSSYLRSLVSAGAGLDHAASEDFARVATELAATMLRSSGAAEAFAGSPESLLYTIQSFMRDNARCAELTLDEVARAHFISRRKLYHLFSQIHTTPSAFLRDERLGIASRALADPGIDHPVATVAQMCGFTDLTTFTRAFRRRFGMTPRDWRASTRRREASLPFGGNARTKVLGEPGVVATVGRHRIDVGP